MEITLRTCEALDAIRSVAEQVPDMAVGAGTIVRPEQAREAVPPARLSWCQPVAHLTCWRRCSIKRSRSSLARRLPEVIFCPAGGIDRATSADYLALPNVACVGGSWLTPTNLVAAQDWDAITALAAHVIA